MVTRSTPTDDVKPLPLIILADDGTTEEEGGFSEMDF